MNYIKYLFIFPFIIPLFAYSQQNGSPDLSYFRYEGTIGTDISITANLVRLFDKLNGNYQYRFLEEDLSTMYFGKTIELNGDIDQEGNVRLKEFGKKDYAFEGQIIDRTFSGSWNAGSDRKVSFTMSEYYPNGSMPMEVYYLRSETNLVDGKAESPTAEIELTLIYPSSDYVNPGITDSVRSIVVNGFFGEGFAMNSPDTMMVNFEEEYFTEYIKQNKDWHETGGASFSWEKVINMSVIYNSEYLLCLEYLKYAYSGGAHGVTNISYDIIYLDNGELLTFTEIFKENTEDQLSELLTDQLRKDYSIPADMQLTEAGFYVEKVSPNRNIYVNGNGVGFLYNSYEIAPYAQGFTNIFLEWRQVAELIRQGTPVYTMSRRGE